MKNLFHIGVVAALAFIGLSLYWYANPYQMPRFLRDNIGFNVSPRSPMQNFRPPAFGPR